MSSHTSCSGSKRCRRDGCVRFEGRYVESYVLFSSRDLSPLKKVQNEQAAARQGVQNLRRACRVELDWSTEEEVNPQGPPKETDGVGVRGLEVARRPDTVGRGSNGDGEGFGGG